MSIHISSIHSESYQEVGGRLACLHRKNSGQHSKHKVFIAFSDNDPAVGTATLWLTKHFAAFPIEIDTQNGEINLSDINRCLQYDNSMVIVQALPLNESVSQSLDQLTQTQVESKRNIVTHQPILKGLSDDDSRKTANILFNQVSSNSQFLVDNKNIHNKDIIYIAGFNITDTNSLQHNLPLARFVPWYLLILNREGVSRIIRQPELDQFLGAISEYNPDMVDLDEIVANIELNDQDI